MLKRLIMESDEVLEDARPEIARRQSTDAGGIMPSRIDGQDRREV